MREGIHPRYVLSRVSCACGNIFETRSTLATIKLEICSQCHPFFTGKHKFVDTAGRLERFQKRFAKTEGKTVVRKPKTVKAAPQETAAARRVLRSTPRAMPAKPVKKDKAAKAKDKPAKG